jgi:hypothetical protein
LNVTKRLGWAQVGALTASMIFKSVVGANCK